MKEQIEAVQRMQDYIDAHAQSEISPADLARASLFSPWHSYRLFRQYTGLTPAEYIRRLRLSRCALRLKNEGCRVIDAALDMGFGSTDGFQRAFHREFGCNPSEYAKNRNPIPLFIPYGVKFKEIRREVSSMENCVFVQLQKKPQRRVIIKRGVSAEDYFAYCGEVGCDVWGTLMSMDSLCGEPVCLWLTDKYIAPGTSRYVQGVESDAPVPKGFDAVALPEAEYLVFQGEPFAEEDYCAAIEAVQHAMDRYDPSLVGCEWDDESPRIQLEPRGERGYIEMRAVRKIK